MSIKSWLFHSYFLLRRPMTLGVRAVVLDMSTQSIFLVRHTYVKGWHFPGGGVERGETLLQALKKELREEGNLELTAKPQLFAIYKNNIASNRDHVVLYLCKDFQQIAAFQANREIAEARFFPLNALPDGLTPATQRRINEVFTKTEPAELW